MQLSSYQKQALSWLLITVLIALTLWLLAQALSPFVVAGILAYALNPLVNRVDGWFKGRMPRWLAVLLIELAFLFLATGVLMLLVPVVMQQLPLIRSQLPEFIKNTALLIQQTLDSNGIEVQFDVSTLTTWLNEYFSRNDFSSSLGSVFSSLTTGGRFALSLLSNLLLIPLALFYFLTDWDRFVALLFSLVPVKTRDSVSCFTNDVNEVLGQYLRGQITVMLLLALFYSVGLMLFGLNLAWPVGIFTGLAVFVPYLGFGIGLCMATLLGLMQMGLAKTFIMVAVVYGCGQILESFFLTPRLMGDRIGLHPLAVIFALLAFGHLFGFIGILVALPSSAVLLVAIRRLRNTYFKSKLYNG